MDVGQTLLNHPVGGAADRIGNRGLGIEVFLERHFRTGIPRLEDQGPHVLQGGLGWLFCGQLPLRIGAQDGDHVTQLVEREMSVAAYDRRRLPDLFGRGVRPELEGPCVQGDQ